MSAPSHRVAALRASGKKFVRGGGPLLGSTLEPGIPVERTPLVYPAGTIARPGSVLSIDRAGHVVVRIRWAQGISRRDRVCGHRLPQRCGLIQVKATGNRKTPSMTLYRSRVRKLAADRVRANEFTPCCSRARI